MWADWEFAERWSVALRPAFYWDPDGLIRSAEQSIRALTGTVKHRFSAGGHRIDGFFEVRYGRSTASR